MLHLCQGVKGIQLESVQLQQPLGYCPDNIIHFYAMDVITSLRSLHSVVTEVEHIWQQVSSGQSMLLHISWSILGQISLATN